MSMDAELDAAKLAIGRLEHALERAENAARRLDEQADLGGDLRDRSALSKEISDSIAQIDSLLSHRKGQTDHG